MRLMKMQMISAVIIAFILLSCMPLAFAASDYSGHFAKDAIEQLITKGTVLPDSNGQVRPDAFILRAEFIKVLNREFGFTKKASNHFNDVDSEAWYAEDFLIAKEAGYLTGDGKGNANPMVEITRGEVAVILSRILGIFKTGESNFTDNSEIPSWAKAAVKGLTEAGILRGYPDGRFMANHYITRGETFYLFYVLPKDTLSSPEETNSSRGNTTSMNFSGSSGSGNSGGGSTGGTNQDATPRPNVVNIDSDAGLLYYGVSPHVTSYQITLSYLDNTVTKEFSINPSVKGSFDLKPAINTLLRSYMEPEAMLTITVAVKGEFGTYLPSTAKTYTFLKTYPSLNKPDELVYSYEYTNTQKNAVFSWKTVTGAVAYEVTLENGDKKTQTSLLAQNATVQTYTAQDLSSFEDGVFSITVKALADPAVPELKNSNAVTKSYNKQGIFLEEGTVKDPYIIKESIDLYYMVNPAGVYYIVSNLTVSKPIPSFTGRIEGRLYGVIEEKPTITLDISETNMERVALFSAVTDGTISNLILTGSVVSSGSEATASTAAGLVGETFGTTNLSGITNYANIKKSKNGSTSLSLGAGGIVGKTSTAGSVINCVNYGTIEVTTVTNSNAGGIVGHGNSPIKNSINYGQVKGLSSVGGLVGISYSGISDCANYGEITATSASSYVGGIAGTYSSSTLALNGCYNAGVITGNANTAGIVGRCYPGVVAKIYNCFNIGSVNSSGAFSGGIMGSITRGTVELSTCYDAQPISQTPYNIMGDNEASSTTGRVIAEDESILYVKDHLPHSGFNGTGISKKDLQNLLLTSTKFNQNSWRILPQSGYPYPQLLSNPCNVPIRMAVDISLETGGSGYTITWEEMPGAGDYKLYLSTNENYTQEDLIESNLSDYTYDLSYDRLTLGKQYYLTVQKEELISQTQGFLADPFTDLNIQVSKQLEGTIFTWDEVSGTEGYELYVGENPKIADADLLIDSLHSPSYLLSHDDEKELIPGKSYYIQVRKGNVISETIHYVPEAEFDLEIQVNRGEDFYTLSWREVPGAGTYRLYIGSSQEFTESDLVSDTITTPNYVLPASQMAEERSYFIQVVKGTVVSRVIEYAPYLYHSNSLKSVTIGGESLQEFDPDVTSYQIVLPYGTTTIPQIQYEAVSYRANVSVSHATGLPGTTMITVTSESGIEKSYTIEFAVIKKVQATITRAGQTNRTTLTIREITGSMTTYIQMRNYNNDLFDDRTTTGFLRFELSEALPENATVISADLYGNFGQIANYVPTFSFYNAVTDWDTKTYPLTDTNPLYSGDVIGSVSNETWKPYSASITKEQSAGSVSLDFDTLTITNGTTLNLAIAISYLDNTSRIGYLYLRSNLGLPTIDIYYIAIP